MNALAVAFPSQQMAAYLRNIYVSVSEMLQQAFWHSQYASRNMEREMKEKTCVFSIVTA